MKNHSSVTNTTRDKYYKLKTVYIFKKGIKHLKEK